MTRVLIYEGKMFIRLATGFTMLEFLHKIYSLIPVLQSIPWDKVDIQVLVIEVHYVGKIFDNDETVESFLTSKGYRLLGNLSINQIYVKEGFEKHKLTKPFKLRFSDFV